MTSRVIGPALLALSLAGCSPGGSASKPASAAAPAGGGAIAPTREQLSNMIYEGIEGQSFTLTNGAYQGEPAVAGGASRLEVTLLDELTRFANLDDDGVEDAAVLLAESSGGSGSRVWVCAVTGHTGEPASYGCDRVGDRPQIRSFAIRDRFIHLDLVAHGPLDPMCCPTRSWIKEWGIVEGKLTAISSAMGETISLERLTPGEWTLTHFDLDEPVPSEPRITARFEAGRIAGAAPCNQYFAGVREPTPGQLEVSAAGTTRKMCEPQAMTLETRFLDRLGRVKGYGFDRGRLALRFESEAGAGTLLFAPAPTR